MADTRWGYAQVVTVTAAAAAVVPAKGSRIGNGPIRSSGEVLIQPIDGKVRFGFDGDPDDEDAPAIGQDVQYRDRVNNEIRLIRDAAEGADVQVQVCYEGQ